MDTPSKEIIIPKEKAVFRMDANGRWHNAHGPFENPKIIAYFNAAIRKDADGYYLYQELEDRAEKVYFPYEDTALFVQGDNLYLWLGDERVKFNDRSLTKLAGHLTEKGGNYYLKPSKEPIQKI